MTECTIYDTDYSDSCTILKQKIVTARKKHCCTECHKDIQTKTKYEYLVGVCAGDLWVSKTCLDCVSLRDTFFPSGGYLITYVREFIAEQIYSLRGEVSSECILPLTEDAKKFVFQQIEDTYKVINDTERRINTQFVQHYPDRRSVKAKNAYVGKKQN